MQWAAYRADSETVQYLVSYGATPDLEVKALVCTLYLRLLACPV